MKLLPVVARELRVIARRPGAYWVRSGAALAAFVAMGYVALVGAAGLPTASQGRSLFDLLSLGTFLYCAMAGVRGTSDALSQEKREGTLGLLFLTDLKGYDVVFGKLLSVSINSIYGVLAVAPPLALAFMMGGTSALQFVLMLALLFNTLFFSLAAGIFISTFSEQERPAMGVTLALIFVALAMPYAIAGAHSFGVLELWEVMESGFLLTSPAFAFWTIKDASMLRIHLDDVLLSLAFTHLAGWLFLVIASASVAQRSHADAPQGRITAWIARWRHEWAYGKASRRRTIRGALLDRNAFAWLAGRDRLKQRYAWIFLALLGALWLAARWKAPEITDEWPIAMFSLWFLHLFFKVWVASEVAARFIEDRRGNGLELLLTTPVKLRELVNGQRLALARQFGPPLAFIVALSIYVAWRAGDSSAYVIRSPNPWQFFLAGLIHLAFDLYAIQWVSIWRSMRLRGANRTIIQAVVLVIILPVVGWFLLWQAAWVLSVSTRGSDFTVAQILWVWTGLCVIYDLTLAALARQAFYRDFREVATNASDKSPRPRWLFRRAKPNSEHVQSARPPARRWSRGRKIAIAGAIALMCLSVALSVRRHRLESQVRARLSAIRAAGMPVSPDDVPRWLPALEPRENASVILRQASRSILISRLPLFLPDPEAQWRSRAKLAPEFRERATAWITNNADLFRTLDQLAGRKPGGGMVADRNRNVIETEQMLRVLQIKARVEMEDDPNAAAKTISTLLHCVRTLQGEHVGAFAGSRKGLEAAAELFARAATQQNFSAQHWAEWKSILDQMDPVGLMREHLLIERAEGIAIFSLPVETLYQRYGRQTGSLQGVFTLTRALRRFAGQDMAELLQYLDYMERGIADIDRPFWQTRAGGRQRFQWRAPTLMSANFLLAHIVPDTDWMLMMAAERRAYQRILMTVCDVEIFRAQNGGGPLPKEIRTQAFLARLDPFSPDPLHFVVTDDGYSIYSVGPDGNDDGGMRATGRHNGDIAFHLGKPPERARVVKKP